jgi:hypothetical protein
VDRLVDRLLDRRSSLYAACGITLGLGLFFIFIWAPHPWGWSGFDRYDTLAWGLARGQPFQTLEVPWGYAYFVAAFYRVFGHRPWIPLVAQAVLNACLPALGFAFARTWLDRRTSMLAAILIGLFSFNTVYVSTLSSDALCTVVFMCAVVLLARACRREEAKPLWRAYAMTGLLLGVAAQLRPNLVLVPVVLAAYLVFLSDRGRVGVQREPGPRNAPHLRRRLAEATVLVAAAAASLVPWVVRTYQLTGLVLPTSVHGSVQLWYGSLQAGPYVHSGARNPRWVFEDPVFDYTSLERMPIAVTGHANACGRPWPSMTSLIYRTDRRRIRQRLVSPKLPREGDVSFSIPAPGEDAVVYYYFETLWWTDRGPIVRFTPEAGSLAPFVYFVSQNHLGDADVHGDLLDIFDVIRIARHVAWDEPLPFARQLAQAGIGESDLEEAVEILAPHRPAPGIPLARGAHELDRARSSPLVLSLDRESDQLTLRLRDGSSIAIPRAWRGRITDIAFDGELAVALMRSHASLARLAYLREAESADPEHEPAPGPGCPTIEEIRINQVFSRREPSMMRRYMALALDNIRRQPWAFARASLYRGFRVFVIQGSRDAFTAQQFRAGPIVYTAATAASATYLTLFLAGVVVAWRRRYDVVLPLLLIAYIPATIAFVLTNMRYSVTVQPLLLMFVALAIESARTQNPEQNPEPRTQNPEPARPSPGASRRRSPGTPGRCRGSGRGSRPVCGHRTDSATGASG